MLDFKALAEAGNVGVSLALIGMVCVFMKLFANHLRHLNDTLLEMVEVIGKLSSVMSKVINKLEKKERNK